MNKIFYTSDTHWSHTNIIKYSNRPFKDVDEMNYELIKRWNSKVAPDDIVQHLGDFALGNQDRVPEIVSRLNGEIHFHWGNHDKKHVRKMNCWASSQPYSEIYDGDDFVILSHYGHRVWNKSHHGSFHLYGHSHGGLSPLGRSLDVGVDCWDYYPVTLQDIKARLTSLGTIDDFRKHHPKENET